MFYLWFLHLSRDLSDYHLNLYTQYVDMKAWIVLNHEGRFNERWHLFYQNDWK